MLEDWYYTTDRYIVYLLSVFFFTFIKKIYQVLHAVSSCCVRVVRARHTVTDVSVTRVLRGGPLRS